MLRLYHTVKYLRWEQVVFRLLRYVIKPKQPKYLPVDIHVVPFQWLSPSHIKQCLFDNNQVVFLGESGELIIPSDWNNLSKSKLWLYNAHYFDDLNAIGFISRKDWHYALMLRWIDENPPVLGNGWEPYPISLRIVNWVKWLSRENIKDLVLLASLHQQAESLLKQLEYHILGNHLFANAKALTFVGVFLQGKKADGFLSVGLKLLDREISEQFLEDGAHFELSPMYHEILLWDLLELIDLAKTSQNKKLLTRLQVWEKVAEKALDWLKSMIHPDGEVSFFNDAAIGIAASPDEIFSYGRSLGLNFTKQFGLLTTNNTSGYSRVENKNYTLLFDHANLGPDYLPSHGHADTLSFEMSVGTQRVFVNSGTSLYGVSKERLRQRETAAHNTVVVNGQSSSEVWSGFRVARRAYAKLLKAEKSGEQVILSASHDGYNRLKPKITHARTIKCAINGCEIIDDLSFKAYAEFNLHLHPDVIVKTINEYTLELILQSNTKVSLSSSLPCSVVETTWHPEFGKAIANKKVLIPFDNRNLITKIEIVRE